MVWGSMTAGGLKRMIVWDQSWGRITSATYIQHILVPCISPIFEDEKEYHGSPFYCMEDNASPHSARATIAARQEQLITPLPTGWPPASPDLNPIEEIWRRMKDYLYRLPERPTTVRTMQEAVWAAWGSISDDDCEQIVNTMPARIRAVYEANGGHTMY